MYKLIQIQLGQETRRTLIRLTDNTCVPFDPANTDYQTFRKEVLAGAELQDADGNVMTQAEANEFIATLP